VKEEIVAKWRRWWKWVLVGAVLAAVGGTSWAITRPAPDDRELLNELVAKAKGAVEAQAPNELMKCFARDYKDDSGLYRGDIYTIAAREARSFTRTEVAIGKSDITVGERGATGRFDVMVTAEGNGITLPWPMKLEVTFAKRRPILRPWRTEWAVTAMKGHGLDRSYATF
jgi:hypothetical protein